MWVTLRNTLSRGRSVVPAIRLRCRNWMRTRRSSFVLIFIVLTLRLLPTPYQPPTPTPQPLLGDRLSGLLLEHFTGVTDALLLVRIRLPEPPDVRRHLPHQLRIHPRPRGMRRL